MAISPLIELTDRARAIFQLVVEGYLETGQPVGSKTLAGDRALDLSPASIRSVLAQLEGAGLLSAPHISAGRMPTDSGLRLFVDGMMQVGQPTRTEREQIETRIGQTGAQTGSVEEALERVSGVLSEMSGAAGMVMVPQRDPALRQVSLVDLGQGRVLAVLVGEDGGVENRIIEVPATASPATLEQASNYITARLAGRTLRDAAAAMSTELAEGRTQLDAASADLVARGLVDWSEDAARRPVLIVRGQANLLDEAALSDLERVRTLIDDLENKQSIATLLESARDAGATRIFIGSENPLFALSGSSVIAAPYCDSEDRVVGVLGVIGPTRLNYARVVPMINFTARSLGKLIGQI